MTMRMPAGGQTVIGAGKVWCLVEKAPKFPELRLEMSVQSLRGESHRFDLSVAATGTLKSRDNWQAAFALWCETQGLYPTVVRGNNRTNRTQARVIVMGGWPVLDSFAQLAGIESPLFGGAPEARISQLEAHVVMLRKQNAEMTQMIEGLQGRLPSQ
jgi:hypothetical protein